MKLDKDLATIAIFICIVGVITFLLSGCTVHVTEADCNIQYCSYIPYGKSEYVRDYICPDDEDFVYECGINPKIPANYDDYCFANYYCSYYDYYGHLTSGYFCYEEIKPNMACK